QRWKCIRFDACPLWTMAAVAPALSRRPISHRWDRRTGPPSWFVKYRATRAGRPSKSSGVPRPGSLATCDEQRCDEQHAADAERDNLVRVRQLADVREHKGRGRQSDCRGRGIFRPADVGEQSEHVTDHVHRQDEPDEHDAPEEVVGNITSHPLDTLERRELADEWGAPTTRDKKGDERPGRPASRRRQRG